MLDRKNKKLISVVVGSVAGATASAAVTGIAMVTTSNPMFKVIYTLGGIAIGCSVTNKIGDETQEFLEKL